MRVARDRRRVRVNALELERSQHAASRGVPARLESGSGVSPGRGTNVGWSLHELQRRHDDRRGAILVGPLQLQHDLAGVIAFAAFVVYRRAGDIPAQVFELPVLIGGTAGFPISVGREICTRAIIL